MTTHSLIGFIQVFKINMRLIVGNVKIDIESKVNTMILGYKCKIILEYSVKRIILKIYTNRSLLISTDFTPKGQTISATNFSVTVS